MGYGQPVEGQRRSKLAREEEGSYGGEQWIVSSLLPVSAYMLLRYTTSYLNEIERITALKYIPTDEDVLKARLKTLGVVEHSFTLKGTGPGQSRDGVEWKIYDVGGARYQRQAWAPYFEDGMHELVRSYSPALTRYFQ